MVSVVISTVDKHCLYGYPTAVAMFIFTLRRTRSVTALLALHYQVPFFELVGAHSCDLWILLLTFF